MLIAKKFKIGSLNSWIYLMQESHGLLVELLTIEFFESYLFMVKLIIKCRLCKYIHSVYSISIPPDAYTSTVSFKVSAWFVLSTLSHAFLLSDNLQYPLLHHHRTKSSILQFCSRSHSSAMDVAGIETIIEDALQKDYLYRTIESHSLTLSCEGPPQKWIERKFIMQIPFHKLCTLRILIVCIKWHISWSVD